MHHLELGTKGEELASEWLTLHGIEILARNWRSGRAEVDIVACDGNQIVFVEVKTRNSSRWEKPESAVDANKQKQLIKAASAWFDVENREAPFRFDIISIVLNDFGKQILHFKDAFFPIGV